METEQIRTVVTGDEEDMARPDSSAISILSAVHRQQPSLRYGFEPSNTALKGYLRAGAFSGQECERFFP